MTNVTENGTLALLANEEGYDPIGDRLRAMVRQTIETMFEEELAEALGRGVETFLNCPVQVPCYLSASVSTHGPIWREPQATGRSGRAFAPRRSGSRGPLPAAVLHDGCSIGLIATYASGAVEHGQVTLRVFVNPDPGIHEMVAMLVRRDLQDQPLVTNGIVVGCVANVVEIPVRHLRAGLV